MFNKLKQLFQALKYCRYYVIADVRDSSISLSKALFNHIRQQNPGNKNEVLVVNELSTGLAGFMVNPAVDLSKTITSGIQYNQRFKSVGFEMLCPTVAGLLHQYGIDPFSAKINRPAVKLFISPLKSPSGQFIYLFRKPKIYE